MIESNHIENLLNWTSYYFYVISPFINLAINLLFDSVVIYKIYNLIKETYRALIEIK
jgi:hypothetical protein